MLRKNLRIESGGMFRISCIVEGDGDVMALPVLLRRAIYEIDPTFIYNIERPIRLDRAKFSKDNELNRAIQLAFLKTKGVGAILIVIDADDDCPFQLGPQILNRAEIFRPDATIKVVLANKEYKGWFLAGAASLAGVKGLPTDLLSEVNAENIRDAKGWLQERMNGNTNYRPTVDQPSFSMLFNMNDAVINSPSFSKFMRDVRAILDTAP